jgi:hypothetical protein
MPHDHRQQQEMPLQATAASDGSNLNMLMNHLLLSNQKQQQQQQAAAAAATSSANMMVSQLLANHHHQQQLTALAGSPASFSQQLQQQGMLRQGMSMLPCSSHVIPGPQIGALAAGLGSPALGGAGANIGASLVQLQLLQQQQQQQLLIHQHLVKQMQQQLIARQQAAPPLNNGLQGDSMQLTPGSGIAPSGQQQQQQHGNQNQQ